MVKRKVVVVESDEGLPEGFITQNLLKNPDNEKCGITDPDLEILRKNQAFPEHTIFFTDPNLTSECYSLDWVSFPEYPFVIGLKFPFPELITKFFSASKLNYTQVMSQVWRILQTLVRLSEEMGLKVGLEELALTTEFRGFGPGRYCFRTKRGEATLISTVNSADRGWKNRFFYVRKESLSQDAGVNQKWRSQEVAKLGVLFSEQPDTESNVDKILELDLVVRSFKAYPVKFSAESVGGIGESEGTLPIEREEEERSAEPSFKKMSTATRSRTGVSASDLLANAKTMIVVKKEGGKPPTPKSLVSTSKTSAGKKVGDTSRKGKLEQVEITEVKDAALKIEKVKETFGLLVKDFTDKGSDLMSFVMGQLVARDEQVEIMKIKAAKESYDAEESKKKARVSASEAEKIKKEVGKLKKEIATLQAQVEGEQKERAKENETHLQELETARKDFEFHATKALLEGRIQLMEEYKNGQAIAWDLEEEKRVLEGFIEEPVDADEVNSLLQDVAANQGATTIKDPQSETTAQVKEGMKEKDESATQRQQARIRFKPSISVSS